MDERTKHLQGSPSRDILKRLHKQSNKRNYACDIDFAWVEKMPRAGVVAQLDYKRPNERITFAEVLAYNDYVTRGIPMFIARFWELNGRPDETGTKDFRFTVERYVVGDWRPDPPQVQLKLVREKLDQAGFEAFEEDVRRAYRRSGTIDVPNQYYYWSIQS